MPAKPKLIGTTEAAARVRLTPGRIRQLIGTGILPATRLGRDLFIDPKDLAAIKDRPGAGWPKGRKRKPRATA